MIGNLRACLAALVLFFLVIGPSGAHGGRSSIKAYALHFPKFKRVETPTSSGRVTEIRVTVDCGVITGVSNIPRGWSLNLQGPDSDRTVLVASADHGAAYIWDLRPWNGSISVMPSIASCFDVSAEVVADGPANDPVPLIRYSRAQLRLVQSALEAR